MKHGRFVDKENIISYNRNFFRRLRLRALMHWINTIALLKRRQATRAVILLPFQKVAAAVLYQCLPCLITLVLHRYSGDEKRQLLAENLFLGKTLSIWSSFAEYYQLHWGLQNVSHSRNWETAAALLNCLWSLSDISFSSCDLIRYHWGCWDDKAWIYAVTGFLLLLTNKSQNGKHIS